MAHLRVAEWEPDDDDEVVIIPALPVSPPQFLPVPSAWWETPAVTSRPLNPIPEEARAARQFVRELLTCWGLGHLSDDAELIIAELVGNAVRHGLRTAPQIISLGKDAPALRLCLLRRIGEVMLAVTDPSDEAPKPKAASADGESGRGLQIVGALSHIWGWSPIEGNGKAVWAVLKAVLPSGGMTPRRDQGRGARRSNKPFWMNLGFDLTCIGSKVKFVFSEVSCLARACAIVLPVPDSCRVLARAWAAWVKGRGAPAERPAAGGPLTLPAARG